ncbi:MAG: class I SAM-dependent methyltransferase [Rhodospirillales bacterium]
MICSIQTENQRQTGEAFGLKWSRKSTYLSQQMVSKRKKWFNERYGDLENADWWDSYSEPVLLDAGCGAGVSAMEVFGSRINKLKYIGIDISNSIEVAKQRFEQEGYEGQFYQTDMMTWNSPIDCIFAEGTLHHTDSTKAAIVHLAKHLRPNGRFIFYVYNKKGWLREWTDDFIRARLSGKNETDKWNALYPLTRLGVFLGKLNIPLQRWFYYKVCKAFYSPELTLEEMNHINFDWFAPANCHRQTPEEVRSWCAEAGLNIYRLVVEPSGITVHAVKE